MRLICALLLAGILAAAAATAPFAADRPTPVALVIGNANYPDNDSVLNDAANDARDVADEPRRDGFAVETGINLTGEAMRQALERLYGRIERGGIALLFYGGFGVQTATRQTYLLPVDAQIWTEADVARDGFNLESVLDQMNSHGAAIKIAARCLQAQPVRAALPPLFRGPCRGGDAGRHARALLHGGRLGRQHQPQ
jgi:Caspase domain